MQSELSIHDNQVYAFVVDCNERRIVLQTVFHDQEPPKYIDVVFQDVLAHFFEHVLPGNILFDIEEISLDQLLRANAALLENSWRYGWPPIEYRGNLAELAAGLSARSTRAFSITSSYGLSGWVLAGSCERYSRQEPVAPPPKPVGHVL